MRLPRMTTRRWTIAVAVVALLLGAYVTWHRAVHFIRLAALHAAEAQMIRSSPSDDPRLADYHEGLARKYERASARPWLLVDPDPPEPE
jgi:hypothetical protein